MPNYFLTDVNGQRRGPVSEQVLRVLVAQEKVLPTTSLETEGGHKGLAGQIPGLFGPPPQPTPADPNPVIVPLPASKQSFCTNCGNAVAEHAVGCMSCGVKPIGHKKFCRQCGAALNPEQVICVKCGANIASPIMPDAKRMVQSVIASSNMEKIKKWFIPAAISGIAVAVMATAFTLFFWGGHPLKNAKPGDWCRYDMIISNDGDARAKEKGGKLLIEVLSNDGKIVKLRHTNTDPWGRNHENQVEIDLRKPQEKLFLSMLRQGLPDDSRNVKIEKGKKTRDTVSAAGKTIDCVVTPYTITLTRQDGEILTVTGKEWTSKTVPLGGLVKSESQLTVITKRETTKITQTVTIAAFGNDPEVARKAEEQEKSARATEGRMECSDRLHKICVALHNYHDTSITALPPLCSVDRNGKPLHSWRVMLLPFIDENDLYNKIRLHEPWDSAYNTQFHRRAPSVYQCPENKHAQGKVNCTYSFVKDSRHGFPEDGKTLGFHSITDGLSNTIAVVEVKKPFCWMDPTADLTLEEFCQGINTSNSRAGSFHSDGINVVMFDGSTRLLGNSVDSKTLRAWATRNGGE